MAGRPEQGQTRWDAIADGEKLAGARRIGDSCLHWSREKNGEQEEDTANSPTRFPVVKMTQKAALGDGSGGDGGGARAWRGVVSRRGDCGSEAWDGEARPRSASI